MISKGWGGAEQINCRDGTILLLCMPHRSLYNHLVGFLEVTTVTNQGCAQFHGRVITTRSENKPMTTGHETAEVKYSTVG